MSKTFIIGRLTDKPRRNNIKKQDGTEVPRCFFTLLEDNGKDKEGNQKKPTAYNISATGKMADVILQYKEKGDLVYVEAEYSPYDTKPVTKSTKAPIEDAYDVVVPLFRMDQIKFLANSKNHAGQGAAQGGTAPADLPSYDQGDFPNEPMLNNSDIPFDMDGTDPFQLSQMP